MTPKFKVGDRVRLIPSFRRSKYCRARSIGEVTWVGYDPQWVTVHWKEPINGLRAYEAKHLELVCVERSELMDSVDYDS